MRTVVVAVIALAGLLALAPAAYAKGPTAATIEGPGLATPVTVSSYEATARLPGLGDLMRLTGASVLFGDTVPTGPDRPPGDLGPRFAVTYRMDRQVVLTQELYPFAAAGPFAFTPAGQRSLFTGIAVPDGWFRAPADLTASMRVLGAAGTVAPAAAQPVPPPQPPASSPSPSPGTPAAWWIAALAALVVAALAGTAVLRARIVGVRR